jgi:oligoendopeptidase F
MWEAGTPLSASVLEKTYRDLVRKYYGAGLAVDENDEMEWAGVPHFYYKYYVWAYATGLSSGIAIADRIRELGKPAADAYLGMLASGCAEPPVELLKKAGVDLTRPEAIEAAMRTFERTLNEVEGLLVK